MRGVIRLHTNIIVILSNNYEHDIAIAGEHRAAYCAAFRSAWLKSSSKSATFSIPTLTLIVSS